MRRLRSALTVITVAALAVALAAPAFAGKPADKGFDEFGYNRTARIFNGPATGWCLERGAGEDCLGIYSYDHLAMKWNAEWDRGNDENWANPPYAAWEMNEWNGMMPGGSGETWSYMIQWVGACGANGTPLADGGYCIWGQFEVILSQGTIGGSHIWETRAKPPGYGA